MLRQQKATAIVCAACAVSVMGHWWIARQSERRIERLLSSSFDAQPFPREEWPAEDVPSIAGMPPRLLAPTGYEDDAAADEACPVDAMKPMGHEPPAAALAEKPLTPRQQQDRAAVREVIEEEMPETSAEERDIWFEELKSLPAEVVRDLLQVRKQLRVLTPDHHLSGPGQLSQGLPGQPPAEREIPAEPVLQRRPFPTDDWSSTREALEQAIAWSTHNIANAATPGYKRWRVVLGDAASWDGTADGIDDLSAIAGRGCGIASLSLDLEPGEIASTGRELDVAIDGEGFFMVHHEPSQTAFYTRIGAWKLTADRRLACLINEEDYFLDRELRIPANATELQIHPDGSIVAKLPNQDTPQKLGQIQLAMLPSPAGLVSQGNGLLTSRLSQEPRKEIPGVNGTGRLRQGSLELSNVDLEQEQQERDHWQEILKLLPPSGLPRTARESDRSSR